MSSRYKDNKTVSNNKKRRNPKTLKIAKENKEKNHTIHPFANFFRIFNSETEDAISCNYTESILSKRPDKKDGKNMCMIIYINTNYIYKDVFKK